MRENSAVHRHGLIENPRIDDFAHMLQFVGEYRDPLIH